jgi:hypothetical protein
MFDCKHGWQHRMMGSMYNGKLTYIFINDAMAVVITHWCKVQASTWWAGVHGGSARLGGSKTRPVTSKTEPSMLVTACIEVHNVMKFPWMQYEQ